MATREGVSNADIQQSLLEEGAFMYEIEKCIFSAEGIMSVTTTTIYLDVTSPPLVRSQPPKAETDLDILLANPLPTSPISPKDLPSPLRPERPHPGIDQDLDLTASKSLDLNIYELDAHPPYQPPDSGGKSEFDRDQNANFNSTNGPNAGKDVQIISQIPQRPQIQQPVRRPEHIPTRTMNPPTSADCHKPKTDLAKDSQILFHLNDIQSERNGNLDSDGDSLVDPEPDFEDSFPPIVYLELISSARQDMQKELEAGEYDKAERYHQRAMQYYIDREKKQHIPFEHRTEMYEILADIYRGQGRLEKAKKVLNRLLMHEKKDCDRKWRLYHTLAEVCQGQNRLSEAEKYAKRAYIGREKSLGRGDGLVLQSVSLLVTIYERQGQHETAEAFKKVYRSASRLSQQPKYSLDHTEIGSYRSGSVISHQSHRASTSTNREDVILNKTRVRWGPDAWVDASSINAPTKSGETPMIAAIVIGDDELVRIMLQRGADVEARCADHITPLMHAIDHGFNSIAELLLSYGAKVDAPTAGWTPLHRATQLVNIDMVSTLLANGADIEARSPKEFLARKHPLGVLRSPTVEGSESDHSSSDGRGWTPFLRAAYNGEEAMVLRLLDKGANIEARNPSNGTPLICACERQHEGVVDILLLSGADVHAEDDFGWKPIHRALVNKGGERIVGLLLSRDANVNAHDAYRKTPLHHAIEKGDDHMVNFLLNAGADIEARDIAERTPLLTAIEARLEIMVRILLENGADTEAMDKDGKNALAAANRALRKSPEIIALLAKDKKHRQSLKRGSYDRGGSRRVSESSPSVSRTSSSGSWWSIRSNKQKR